MYTKEIKRYIAYNGETSVPFYLEENAIKWCEKYKDFKIQVIKEKIKIIGDLKKDESDIQSETQEW